MWHLRDNFRELPDLRAVWVRPSFVVEFEYRQRLKGGLRYAALKGTGSDKVRGCLANPLK